MYRISREFIGDAEPDINIETPHNIVPFPDLQVAPETDNLPVKQPGQKYFPLQPVEYERLLDVVKYTEPSGKRSELEAWEPAPSIYDNEKVDTAVNSDKLLYLDNIGLYLNSVSKIKLLDAEQEVLLAKRIESGVVAEKLLEQGTERLNEQHVSELEWLAQDGAEAKEHFLTANLRLVVSTARKYRAHGAVEREDIIHEGNIGLDRAVKKFDYKKGYKFSTYATNWIQQFIQRGMANDANMIDKPTHVTEQIRKLWGIETDLLKHDVEPTTDLLAEKMKCKPEHIDELREWGREPVRLETPMSGGASGVHGAEYTLGDMIDQKFYGDNNEYEAIEHREQQEELYELLKLLDVRAADIVCSRFGFNGRKIPLDELGSRYGITTERVRQIEKKSLNKLREIAQKTQD